MTLRSFANVDALNELQFEHVDALIRERIPAIVIDGVASADECRQYCGVIRELCEASDYKWGNDLKAIGRSIGEAHESSVLETAYFDGAEATTALYRDEIFNGVSPIGRLRRRLNEIMPGGVETAERSARVFLPEIVRRWKEHGGAHPHIDQSNTHLLGSLTIEHRLGLNAYLNMPPEGGEIEFWTRKMSDAEYEALKRPDYGVDRALLGEPVLRLKPKAGQAVMFRADRLHAVSPINMGRQSILSSEDRITNASFLCVRRERGGNIMFA